MNISTTFFNEHECPIVGAGNYGIVVQTQPTKVMKLLKQIDAKNELVKEATIQEAVSTLFKSQLPEVKVPKITYYSQDVIRYKEVQYLCGIGMEYIQPPKGFLTQVHTSGISRNGYRL